MSEYNERKAALIGKYALYRFTYMKHTMGFEFSKLLMTREIWEHFSDVQKTMEEYIQHYTRVLMKTSEFKSAENQLEYMREMIEKEEERIGNQWVCVPDPYSSESFCEWSAAAHISGILKEHN